MRLLVGLGNPGPSYRNNRHNVGFMAVDRVHGRLAAAPWRKKFQGQLAEATSGGEKLLLLKPETFMNHSGRAVQAAMAFYKMAPEDVIVFHDELDLAAGKLRVKRGGGHAGHNGLRDIHARIGPAYARVRIGVGHPGDKDKVAGHVLNDFAKADAAWRDAMLDAIADNLDMLLGGDDPGFMSRVAQTVNPPRSGTGKGPRDGGAAQQDED